MEYNRSILALALGFIPNSSQATDGSRLELTLKTPLYLTKSKLNTRSDIYKYNLNYYNRVNIYRSTRYYSSSNLSNDSVLSKSSVSWADLPLFNGIDVVKELNNEQFYQWLAGFSDAEAIFGINYKSGNTFAFFYSIELHKDDKPLLEYIQYKLGGIGTIYTYKNTCLFRIIAQNEIASVIKIFETENLNTTKRDDLDIFRKAFFLYTTSKQKSLIKEEILSLKNGMNTNRPYEISTYTDIMITDYWFLGFLMGDGSFWFSKVRSNVFYPNFAIVQTSRERPLLEKIQSFLEKLVHLPLLRKEKAEDSSLSECIATPSVCLTRQFNITVRDNPAYGNSKPSSTLKVVNEEFFIQIFIPYLDSLNWPCGKKARDYWLWRSCVLLKYQGKHYLDEGIKLISEINSVMNSRGYSTYSDEKEDNRKDDLFIRIAQLLAAPSNLETQEDGRIIIKSSGKVYSDRRGVVVKLIDAQTGIELKSFSNMEAAGKYLGVSGVTVRNRIKSNKTFNFNNKEFYIKT